MTILITGATGLVGRALTLALLEQGTDVRVVTRRPHRVLEAFAAYSSRVLAFEWHPRTEPFPPEALAGVERVIHLMGEPLYGPATRAVRQRDPYYAISNGWVVRRLGPHCGRIELAQFPRHRDEKAILKAMGAETANLHLATAGVRGDILRDLGQRKAGWLRDATQAMAAATEQDWKEFRSAGEGS